MAGLTCCVLWLGTVFTLSASDWRRREGEGARGTRDPPPPSPVVYFSYEISNVQILYVRLVGTWHYSLPV